MADYTVSSVDSWESQWWQPEMMFDDPPMPEIYGQSDGLSSSDTATLWSSEPCNIDPANCVITITFKVYLYKSNFSQLLNFYS